MDPELKTIAQETFNKLPQDIKETIFSDDYQDILNTISKENSFSPEQQGKFEFETTMVLMGVHKRATYPFNLEFELGIDEDTAEKINKEMTDTIFADVWRLLDEIDADEVGTKEEQGAKIDYEEKKIDEEEISEPNSIDIGIAEPKKPVGAIALTSLSDRLKQASIAAPAKRDYTLDKNPINGPLAGSDDSSTANIPSEAPRAIDPYHESIDNE